MAALVSVWVFRQDRIPTEGYYGLEGKDSVLWNLRGARDFALLRGGGGDEMR